MIGSEFGIKNIKAWIHSCLVSTGSGWWWWCNGVGDIFLAHFGPLVPIEHRLNATVYLSIVADHVHPFMTTVCPSSDGYFQQDNAWCHSSNHLRLVSWTRQWVHFTQMASTSHQISIQWSTFGMWWNRRFTSWMCSRQICSNCVMLSCQYGPKSLRNVSKTLLNLCHEESRQFWRQKGVQPGTSTVYLIGLQRGETFLVNIQKLSNISGKFTKFTGNCSTFYNPCT